MHDSRNVDSIRVDATLTTPQNKATTMIMSPQQLAKREIQSINRDRETGIWTIDFQVTDSEWMRMHFTVEMGEDDILLGDRVIGTRTAFTGCRVTLSERFSMFTDELTRSAARGECEGHDDMADELATDLLTHHEEMMHLVESQG